MNPPNALPFGPPGAAWSSPVTPKHKLQQYQPPAQLYMCTKGDDALTTTLYELPNQAKPSMASRLSWIG